MLSKTHIKYIQSLHHKKFRDEDGVFIAEGSKVVIELLSPKKFDCIELIGLQEWLHENESSIRKFYSGEFYVATNDELDKISTLSSSNQVLAIFKKAIDKPIDIIGRVSLILDTIQDPGNFGTIIRIADWFGISTIICSETTVDMYNPKVVQSTMGSLVRVNIVYTDLNAFILNNKGIKIIATALNGKDIHTIKGLKEAIIIIGNESKGISKELMDLANERITIPKKGEAESLNAAVATGIILSHL
jgi:TrmH family RNA methyltransferase